jgi:hypothetical protein
MTGGGTKVKLKGQEIVPPILFINFVNFYKIHNTTLIIILLIIFLKYLS